MRIFFLWLAVPVLVAMGLATPAVADDEIIDRVFTGIERALIHEYYDQYGGGGGGGRGHGNKGLPPGIAKRGGDLPPGLQKHLERFGQLPPGLEKRLLPGDLHAGLPYRPPIYERRIVGADVILVEVATGIILDILHDVIR